MGFKKLLLRLIKTKVLKVVFTGNINLSSDENVLFVVQKSWGEVDASLSFLEIAKNKGHNVFVIFKDNFKGRKFNTELYSQLISVSSLIFEMEDLLVLSKKKHTDLLKNLKYVFTRLSNYFFLKSIRETENVILNLKVFSNKYLKNKKTLNIRDHSDNCVVSEMLNKIRAFHRIVILPHSTMPMLYVPGFTKLHASSSKADYLICGTNAERSYFQQRFPNLKIIAQGYPRYNIVKRAEKYANKNKALKSDFTLGFFVRHAHKLYLPTLEFEKLVDEFIMAVNNSHDIISSINLRFHPRGWTDNPKCYEWLIEKFENEVKMKWQINNGSLAETCKNIDFGISMFSSSISELIFYNIPCVELFHFTGPDCSAMVWDSNKCKRTSPYQLLGVVKGVETSKEIKSEIESFIDSPDVWESSLIRSKEILGFNQSNDEIYDKIWIK